MSLGEVRAGATPGIERVLVWMTADGGDHIDVVASLDDDDANAVMLRRAFEEAADFRTARALLADTPIASPAIFSLAGIAPGETAIIERTEEHAFVHDGTSAAANAWQAPGWRGRGAGRRAVELISDEVFSTTLAPAVSVFTSIRNERAVRAYEQAGFRWVRIHDDPIQGPCWMMVRDRPGLRG